MNDSMKRAPIDGQGINIVTPPTGAMKTEPAVAIGGTITAIMLAMFTMLKAFDVPVTDDMSSGVTAFVAAVCALPAVGGALTRFFVYSPATTQELANESAVTGDASIPKPPAK